ncbi:16S rRNA (cytosine1402-N4)-methyltransferase [Deinobacterium chartae]|uniref:Ribosomal RNA small subunit methyltransferase H n=1 Tax=Deinobacterium chartae TaxID=521158 RepID=A0A841HWI1_9DEIO|nr:16S rRNA (cytosine(1402)-N(4))-methyltransferase RsmH [Deinobacterium chartae]MBB6097004.1 16S rRNA (cytosine1402-N4)-methyltransferase [Deinobacterium chartae]
MTLTHIPVLARAVLEGLEPAEGKLFVDGTLGGAGHTRLLLEAGARVIGIDQDPYALNRAREAALEGLTVLEGNFRHMDELLRAVGVTQVDGVLLDIGVSSFQLDDAPRGFSYHEEAPLDMRMSSEGTSAYEVINDFEPEEIAAILYEYGEERHSRRIAREIVQARSEKPIETTTELAAIIKRAYPGGHARGIHPARRSFQALRIYVNDELGALQSGLEAAARIIRPGGRLAVITFHSLEDRIAKRFLRGENGFTPVNKRPVTADEAELEANPRARSAKLRVATRDLDAPEGGGTA